MRTETCGGRARDRTASEEMASMMAVPMAMLMNSLTADAMERRCNRRKSEVVSQLPLDGL